MARFSWCGDTELYAIIALQCHTVARMLGVPVDEGGTLRVYSQIRVRLSKRISCPSILCLIPQTSFSLYLFVYLYVLWGIGASIGIRRCKTISVDVAVAGVYYVMCRSIVGSGCVPVLWRSCGMV